jgi:hypothetical protein
MDERVVNEFGLNHAQMRYLQRAVPGNEKFGYSQALLGVDGEWRGIEVRALEREKQVIENTLATQTSQDRVGPDTEDTQRRPQLERTPVGD